MRLYYPSQDELELLLVSSLPIPDADTAEFTLVSPFTELAQAIAGAGLGSTVSFHTPRGLREATVAEVLD